MKAENRIINGLWIGDKLSLLEELTIQSFIDNGHVFHLWVYAAIETRIKEGLVIKDANQILPSASIFKYPEKGAIDWGAGSYAGFSDLFRYRLLYEEGGWWTDMDVTCLKPWDIDSPYFFRNHWKYKVVGNVMKTPKGCATMLRCFEETAFQVTEHNHNWHLPIEILNSHLEKDGLMTYRRIGLFNLDIHINIKNYLELPLLLPIDWMGVHWINSSGKLKYRAKSTFANLLTKHSIIATDVGRKQSHKQFVDWFESLFS
ncbi:MAG: hypothetical protein H6601_07830 [Flavobacteriales bacterium]|nr:hypothetical protein [Flavobacteriales bacterium]MCB9205108.1 hypothetical protein [Flavobacteriales bacterium]